MKEPIGHEKDLGFYAPTVGKPLLNFEPECDDGIHMLKIK